MTLDSILNVVVPVLIFFFLGLLIYIKAQRPLDKFFIKIRDWLKEKKEVVEETVEDDPWGPISFRGGQY